MQLVGVDAQHLPDFAQKLGNQCSVQWLATFTPQVRGEYVFTLRGTDWTSFYVDDRIVHSLCGGDPVTESRALQMEAGREYRLRVVSCLKFGHGLSYTSFEWTDMRLEDTDGHNGSLLRVRCRVKNTGKRAGAEVVQCYVVDIESSLPRPGKDLKAFRKVFLSPGESAEVAMDLDRRAFSFWVPGRGWVAEPGRFHIVLGASSKDIRLTGEWNLRPGV